MTPHQDLSGKTGEMEMLPALAGDVAPARRAVMALVCRATLDELREAVDRFAPLPKLRRLRPAEVGLVMLQGRIGGDGAPFNLGEATVTRAAIHVENGATGVSYLLGRAPEAAEAAALLDALWQDEALRMAVEQALAPIRRRLAAEAAKTDADRAATTVDFFTLVRGEN